MSYHSRSSLCIPAGLLKSPPGYVPHMYVATAYPLQFIIVYGPTGTREPTYCWFTSWLGLKWARATPA